MQKPETKRVYYLTGCMPAIACIALSRLKVSRFNDLNDPFELMAVNVGDKAIRRAFKAARDKLSEERGMICFTEDWKNPLMWGHYAEKHAGIALGFDVPSGMLTKVAYAKKLFDLNLDPRTKEPGIGTDFSHESNCAVHQAGLSWPRRAAGYDVGGKRCKQRR